MLATAKLIVSLGFAAGLALAQRHGEQAAKEMGPAAFMWPPDRQWGADQDNTAPCGSASGVKNRTVFPLLNGQVALVAQDESWQIQVSISHKNDPTSNDDFKTVIEAMNIPELDAGHKCYPIPNPPSDIEAGSNGTLQIKYTSDFFTNVNETFYACADITYVPTSQFNIQVPCFNATVDDFEPPTEVNSTASGAAGRASATGSAVVSTSKSSSGLSGGAIAGIVVGVVFGVLAIIGALVFVWRGSQKKKRLRQQEANVRNVKWEDHRGTASQSSDQDIALGKL